MAPEQFKFIPAPRWEQVEKFTVTLINILQNNKLTYTEKCNILSITRSAIEREFNMLGVLSFIELVSRQEELAEKEKLAKIYS